MSTPSDPEWTGLMEAWQAEALEETPRAPLSDEVRRRIRARVRWETIRLFAVAAGEVALIAGMLTWLITVLDLHRPADLAALIGVVVLFAVTFYFTLLNRRGTWWPAAESTTTFVDLSILRCRRKLRSLPFCYRLLGVELALLIPWAVWSLLSRPVPPPLSKWLELLGSIILLPAVFLLWCVWYKRKTLRELAEWEALRQSLGEEPEPSPCYSHQ